MPKISMGLDASLERQSLCSKSRIPKPDNSHQRLHPIVEGNTGAFCRSCLSKNLDNNCIELDFDTSLAPSRKSMPSMLSRVTSNEELKRGSIYQSSESVRKMKGLRTIHSSRNRDVSLTFTIIDSLSQPGQDESGPHAQKKRLSQFSSDAGGNKASIAKNYIASHSSECVELPYHFPEDQISYSQTATDGPPDGFLEICLDSEDAEWCCSETVGGLVEKGLLEEPKFKCDQTFNPQSDGNGPSERERTRTLSKSLSAKVWMSDSSYRSEFDRYKSSPKFWLSPLRRMLDPVKKSKLQWDPPFLAQEINDHATVVSSPGIRRDRTLRKSLLHDFSKTAHKTEGGAQLIKNDHQNSVTASSPAHLHGLLKLEHKHGIPSFEFSVKNPEDVLAAKTWRTANAFDWVYTFHSINSKKKSTRQKQPIMVGQMQVSCYLFSKMRNGGSLDTSTVSEFVLYDIAQARKSLAVQEAHVGESLGISTIKPNGILEPDSCTHPKMDALCTVCPSSLDNYPWRLTELHPHLEHAAIIIQTPFERRENLKDRTGDDAGGKEGSTLSGGNVIYDNPCPMNAKVVIPSGTHGLPSTDEGGPSKLLDRWRSGGGCDCGGWDMACPIVVFENPIIEDVSHYPSVENHWPFELFIKGSKEKIAALNITALNQGEYSVDFHAQLSTLQAFSICVALLHTAEVSTAVGQEQGQHRLQCSSLKVLFEEEVRYLMEAVAEEEKRKAVKQTGEIPPYFILDPPFSPMGRV